MPLSAEIVESDSKKERECSSGPVPQKREQGRVCSYCCAHEADELSAFLLLIESDNHYRVDEVMKKSAFEVTERVTFVADNYVERSPFSSRSCCRYSANDRLDGFALKRKLLGSGEESSSFSSSSVNGSLTRHFLLTQCFRFPLTILATAKEVCGTQGYLKEPLITDWQ